VTDGRTSLRNKPRGPLQSRWAQVTGAASPIGRARAMKLGELGATIVVADRDAKGAAAVAVSLHGEAWVVDLAQSEALHTLDLQVDISSTTPASSTSTPSPSSRPRPSVPCWL
jgi:3-hydroxybutyrate dehydrogenase